MSVDGLVIRYFTVASWEGPLGRLGKIVLTLRFSALIYRGKSREGWELLS